MGLSEEQRAMMRLLAQRDVGYEDVAAVMGISVEEVESRVGEALAAMSESDEAPAPAAAADKRRRARPRPSLPRPTVSVPPQRRRLVAVAASALAAVGAVLLVIYLISGSGSSGGTSAEASPEGAAASRNITQARLEPVGDSQAQGRAIFGRISNTAVLQVQAEGLDPSPKGKSYTVWLYRSPKLALRVGAVKVRKSGLGAQFPLPNQLLNILAGDAFDHINVSLTDDAAYKSELAKAKRERRLPAYSGKTVLSGEITGPLVEQQQ